ncbi:MAG: hypothetical protein P8K14_00130 [Flavobacteriaceae bacterium]|jgi:hypothetical protein|nr:hypothetical protein [Flavobacteriaceae bacterium]
MNERKISLFSIPLLIMGITMIFLGARWMIVDEPWMLDKVANEERLEMSFDQLFQAEINNTLPGYLRQIYQFFGLWVGVIGLFIFLFSRTSLTNISKVRISLLICIGIMILFGTIMAHMLIPSSPFVYLAWALVILYSISLYAHKSI